MREVVESVVIAFVTALILGAGGVALHNPVAGIALPVATVALNRGWFPVTARVADALSRVPEVPPALAHFPVVAPGAAKRNRPKSSISWRHTDFGARICWEAAPL